MWRSILGKYKEVVAAIAVFIVLDAGVLLLNFYTSYQISDDAHAIHLASRQTMLTQRIFYYAQKIKNDLQNNDNFEENQKQLAVSFKQFDEVLDAFIYGGTLIGQGQGQDDLLVDDSYQALSNKYLKPAEDIWRPYRLLVRSLVYAEYYDEDLDVGELLDKSILASQYASDNGDQLLAAVSNFSNAVEKKAHDKAINLRRVQAVAIALAVINFFVILFHFIKRLSVSDEVAQKAKDETADIMHTVNDGLFLLDKHYNIGSQYSSSLSYLFKRDGFNGQNFFDLLKPLVTPDTLIIAKDYIDSLFNERVKSSLMDDLNPLLEVSIFISSKYNSGNHFFSFAFSRVYENNRIIKLLVSVKDVTEVVLLRHKLATANDRINQEAESLFSLVNVDSVLLKEFLHQFDKGLASINEELEKPLYSFSAFVTKLDKIKRTAHSLKGEASMLGLTTVENSIHALEDKLNVLGQKNDLEGDDFLPITIELNALVKTLEIIKVFSSGASLEKSLVTDKSLVKKIPPLHDAFKDLANQLSRDTDKNVKLNLSRFDESAIPVEVRGLMKTILIQLIRNAIVHGLEKPEKRKKLGKPNVGLVALSTEKVNNNIVVVVQDDGRGINFKAIKKHLLKEGKYSEQTINGMSARDLIKFIFQPGFSTAKKVDKNAGRGVGLDVVKEFIDDIGASLSVSCKAERYSEFRIRIPIKSDALVEMA